MRSYTTLKRCLVFGLCAILAGSSARAADNRAVPGRIIVKYLSTVHICGHCLSPGAGASASVTGIPSLDALDSRYRVQSARPLFAWRHKAAGLATSQATNDWLDGIRARFPVRSARAAPGRKAPDIANIYVIDYAADADPLEVAQRYADDPNVEYAHPDRIFSLALVPNDPFFNSSGTWGQPYGDLWGLQITNASSAWDRSTGTGVVVAVIDTGVASTHPDLAGRMWSNPLEVPGNGIDDDGNGFVDDVAGWDFVDADSNPTDPHGHGTHVAGTIAATGNDAFGILGMAWGAKIMALRSFGTSGTGQESDLVAAIVYAAEQGADVISNSWGGFNTSEAGVIVDAVNTALALGAVVVAAAGNNSGSVDNLEPAKIPGVIAVGATDASDNKASFSNFGNALAVGAPGVDILSLRAPGTELGPLVGTQHMRLSGTSMATPHVSGLAALLLADQPGLTTNEVAWHLELNADQPGYPGYEGKLWNPYFGYGRINASRVFDPPPVATRVSPQELRAHVYEGEIKELGTLDLRLTTRDPLAWTLTTPSWVVPSASTGTGPTTVSLTFDGTGIASSQSLLGQASLNAPGAINSDTAEIKVSVHRDARLGGEISVAPDPMGYFDAYMLQPFSLRSATNGDVTLVAWFDRAVGLRIARFAGGQFTGLYRVATKSPTKFQFDIASDGTNFLIVWASLSGISSRREGQVIGRLISPDMTFIDGGEIVIDSRSYRGLNFFYHVNVDFDGKQYMVFWEHRRPSRNSYKARYYFARVETDGTMLRRRRRFSTKRSHSRGKPGSPAVRCATGSCLVTWRQSGATYSVPVVGFKPNYKRINVILRTQAAARLAASDGTNYLLVGYRFTECAISGISFVAIPCRWDPVALRVSGDNVPIDTEPILLNPTATSEFRLKPYGASVTFDGTNYIITYATPLAFQEQWPTNSGGGPVFMVRLSPDGTLLDAEQDGLLVSPVTTAGPTTVEATNDGLLVAWMDRRFFTGHFQDHPFGSIFAQRMAP